MNEKIGKNKIWEKLPHAETVYLSALGVILPLVVHDGYYDITETKTLAFCIMSALYFLWSVISRAIRGERILRLRFSVGMIAAMAFAVVALISTFHSPLGWESFFGMRCRWQGSGMMLLYVLLLLIFSAGNHPDKSFMIFTAVGLSVCCMLAVLDHQGMSVLPFSAHLSSFDRGRFISTLGNLNFAGAYVALLLPMMLYGFMAGSNGKETFFFFLVSWIALWGGMAIVSECVLLGTGTAFLFLPFLFRDKPKSLLRWGGLWILLPLAMHLYRLLCHQSGCTLSDYTELILRPEVCLLSEAFGAASLILIRKRPERFLPIYRVVLLAAVCIGVLLITIINIKPNYVNKYSFLSLLIFDDSWGTDRIRIWKYCWQLFQEYSFSEKLIGRGCGVLASVDVAHRLFPDAILDAAHCEYLQYLLHWGILGLGAYLVWLFFTARRAFRSGDALAGMLVVGGIGYCVQATVNIAQTPATALFFAFLAAQAALSQKRNKN